METTIADVPPRGLVSACGASQEHAAISDVQQEIMASNSASHVTSPGKTAVDDPLEMVVVDCR
jgi:hypothetical protein